MNNNVEVSTFVGDDGATVVQVDSQEGIGRLRVNLNDAPVFDGDPETIINRTFNIVATIQSRYVRGEGERPAPVELPWLREGTELAVIASVVDLLRPERGRETESGLDFGTDVLAITITRNPVVVEAAQDDRLKELAQDVLAVDYDDERVHALARAVLKEEN